MFARRLAIIPCRGGSKGVPRKNLAIVNGLSLTARAILFSQESGLFDLIHVSTDDEEIASEAKKYGSPVLFLRSSSASSDSSSSTDVIREVHQVLLEQNKNFESIALLEPTSPMRTTALVRKTIEAIEGSDYDAALTLSPISVNYHPDKQFSVSQDGEASFFTNNGREIKSRQQLSTTYIRNGFCYAIRGESIERGADIFGSKLLAVVCDIPYVNIDSSEDLELCRMLLK
jgi:CMP-N,N'-diacetyllegionaminic acid synthase